LPRDGKKTYYQTFDEISIRFFEKALHKLAKNFIILSAFGFAVEVIPGDAAKERGAFSGVCSSWKKNLFRPPRRPPAKFAV
jgi:hypothetical protein